MSQNRPAPQARHDSLPRLSFRALLAILRDTPSGHNAIRKSRLVARAERVPQRDGGSRPEAAQNRFGTTNTRWTCCAKSPEPGVELRPHASPPREGGGTFSASPTAHQANDFSSQSGTRRPCQPQLVSASNRTNRSFRSFPSACPSSAFRIALVIGNLRGFCSHARSTRGPGMSDKPKGPTPTLTPAETPTSERQPSAKELAWEKNTLQPFLEKNPERAYDFTTTSGHPIRRLYTEADLA